MDITGINIDFITALAVIGMSALILHYKSHVKFVALGVFVGLVIMNTIPLENYFVSPGAESLARVAILLVPAMILGVNHAVDKRKKGSLVWKIIFILVFTLFFLSSIAQVLPPNLQQAVMDRSIIGWQVLGNYGWFTLAAAILVLADSIQHRHYAEKAKKRKLKSKD